MKRHKSKTRKRFNKTALLLRRQGVISKRGAQILVLVGKPVVIINMKFHFGRRQCVLDHKTTVVGVRRYTTLNKIAPRNIIR